MLTAIAAVRRKMATIRQPGLDMSPTGAGIFKIEEACDD
jgi:hypothetical protein